MLKLHSFILILSLFVTCVSCGGRELTEEAVQVSELLGEALANNPDLIFDSTSLKSKELIIEYYAENDNAPVWIHKSSLNNRGKEMYAEVENAYYHGLLPEMYRFSAIEKSMKEDITKTELLLTNAFFLMTTDLAVGFMDSTSKEIFWKGDSINFDLKTQLNKVFEDSIKNVITENEPTYWEYHQLKNGLQEFVNTYPLDTNTYEIPKFKDDSVACYAATKKALLGHGFLDSTDAENDSIFIESIKTFQKVNGLLDDAIVGKWTSRKLAQSNLERFYQGALALEKWRWKTNPYPERYIRVNIPEYTLYFVDSNLIKRKHRVIVGAYATQTPEFHAKMKTMVTYPYWHLPFSISSTEFFWAAKKDTSYARRKGYKMFRNGEEVDAATVDWTGVTQFNFPYKVRQEGGNTNSLGRIKFLFPNKHMVFIHDTPGKYLFKNDIRAYSHGCVRLHQPFELAKAIITSEENKIINDTLDSIVYRKEQRVIEVKKKFEVFIEYISAVGDSSGNAIFYPDVYGRDDKYLNNTLRKIKE
ncbi:MAG: L,D-transpeptidase family protein [Crocinitomicaceae bacterium]|nr:L,D-transpeptidase family protein [Crocinitomicaceae bacterium]